MIMNLLVYSLGGDDMQQCAVVMLQCERESYSIGLCNQRTSSFFQLLLFQRRTSCGACISGEAQKPTTIGKDSGQNINKVNAIDYIC